MLSPEQYGVILVLKIVVIKLPEWFYWYYFDIYLSDNIKNTFKKNHLDNNGVLNKRYNLI